MEWGSNKAMRTLTIVKNIPPPPEVVPELTSVKRAGRIATMRIDTQSPLWNYTPRRPSEILAAWPQTFVYNHEPRIGKGSRLPLTRQVLAHCEVLNPIYFEKLYIPATGWINSKTETPLVDPFSPTSERLSWSANHVIVVEERGLFSRVYAENAYTSHHNTFFTPDGRLVSHKFNAIHKDGHMIKFGSGIDLYTPFTTDGDMWCETRGLEFWPALPYTLSDGRVFSEYVLEGYSIYGVMDDKSRILLRERGTLLTSWRINSPEVPI